MRETPGSVKLQPTPEQWECLLPLERFNFKVFDWMNRTPWVKGLLSIPNATLNRWFVEFFTGKTCLEHGFENFRRVDPTRGVLVVVNHRSFYDQFAIASRLFGYYGNHHRIYFPIRAPFFYDSAAGLLVNMTMSYGAMYPPIIRDQKRKAWNRFATDVMAELLTDPRNMIGFHPEGTRSREPDPYRLLPGKPGCGMLIHRARPNVVPVFLQGFPDALWGWPPVTLGLKKLPAPTVHMVMGAPLDFSEEFEKPAEPRVYAAITRRVMAALHELAEREKAIRAEWEGVAPAAVG